MNKKECKHLTRYGQCRKDDDVCIQWFGHVCPITGTVAIVTAFIILFMILIASDI